jgi:hypothetical protein
VSTWRRLQEVLDAAAARGEAIRFWWRDDDAGRDRPELTRLLELAGQHDAPLALAVVPLWLEPDAQAQIAASRQASVLQHGSAHTDHGPVHGKPIELGGRRPDAVAAEIGRGRALLLEAFGSGFLAVQVPPWNRIDPALIGRLPGLGFSGLSTFGRRATPEPAPGLVQINTHLDPIHWRETRLFVGEPAGLTQLIDALDAEEPIGLLSHHLAMDEPGWRFLEQLIGLLSRHAGARLCEVRELLGAPA